jgi:hypothetical protein
MTIAGRDKKFCMNIGYSHSYELYKSAFVFMAMERSFEGISNKCNIDRKIYLNNKIIPKR